MHAYQDFREFLTVLEEQKQLLRITDPVKLEPDLAAAALAATKMGQFSPALLFSNVAGYTDARIAMNVHGSWANHALAMGMDKDTPLRDQFFEFVRRYQMYPGPLERVKTAPWQEVVVDKDIDLYRLLPLFRLNEGDGAFFIDKACVISRDPDDWKNDDVENVGCYRLQVKDRNHLGIQTVPQHDIALQLAHAEARGEDLPVAIAVGNEPIIMLMAATPMLYTQLEYKMAAVFQGNLMPWRMPSPLQRLAAACARGRPTTRCSGPLRSGHASHASSCARTIFGCTTCFCAGARPSPTRTRIPPNARTSSGWTLSSCPTCLSPQPFHPLRSTAHTAGRR